MELKVVKGERSVRVRMKPDGGLVFSVQAERLLVFSHPGPLLSERNPAWAARMAGFVVGQLG